MKKIILSLILSFSFATLFAQSYNKNLSSYAYLIKRGTFDSTLILPYHDTTINSALYRPGVIVFNTAHEMCIWNGDYWNVFKPFSGGGDTTNLSSYWDSLQVKNYVTVWVNGQGFLKTEVEPIFTTSVAYNITAQDTLHWDSAYVRSTFNDSTYKLYFFSADGRTDSMQLKAAPFDTTNIYAEINSKQDTGNYAKGNGTVSVVAGNSAVSIEGGTQPLSSNPNFIVTPNNTMPLWNAVQLQGLPILNTAPSAGQVLFFNGTSWAPYTLNPGSGTVTSVGLNTGYGTVVTSNTTNPVTSVGTFTISVDTTKIPNFRYTDSALAGKKNLSDSTLITGYSTIGGMNDSLNKINGINGWLYNPATKTGQVDSTKYSTVRATHDSIVANIPNLSIYTKYTDTSSMLTPYTKKGSNISQFVNDVPYYKPSDTISNIATKHDLRIDTVSTISQLEAYNRLPNVNLIYVTDSLRGGLFYKFNDILTADSGVVFSANGGGYWVRSYNKSLGVNVDWWGSRDSYSILKAVSYVGKGGIINFTPKKIYISYDAIIPDSGQIFNGNNAILLRANDTAVKLSETAQVTDSIIYLSSVPSSWKVGDWIQLFQDSIAGSAMQFSRKILAINDNSISLNGELGVNSYLYPGWVKLTDWNKDSTYIHKVFAQFSGNDAGDFYNFEVPLNFTIDNLVFDGNWSNNSYNHSWEVNAAIFNRGYDQGCIIKNCKFYNMPNDCINGQGFNINNNIAKYLSASFVHLSGNDTLFPIQEPSIITNNFTDSTNMLSPSIDNGHSYGIIEESYTSGFYNIQNNRFYNSLNGYCFGEAFLATATDTADGGRLDCIITGNYYKNFVALRVGYPAPGVGRVIPGHIFISNNVFDNCGTNNWSNSVTYLNSHTDTIFVGENLLVGGTSWIFPVLNSDTTSRYVFNNSTLIPQKASINITSSISSQSLSNNNNSNFLSATPTGKIILSPIPFNPIITSPISGQSIQYNGTSWVNWTPDYLKKSDLHDSLAANALDVLFPLSLNATNKTLSADTTMKDSSLVNYRQMKQLNLQDVTNADSITSHQLVIQGQNIGGNSTNKSIWFGQSSGENPTGTGNTFIGAGAGLLPQNFSYNTALGYQANGQPRGNYNIGVGTDIFGSSAGGTPLNGYNIYIGNSINTNATSDSNSIVIGQNENGKGSNTTLIGTPVTTANYFYGAITTTGALLGNSASITNNVAAGGIVTAKNISATGQLSIADTVVTSSFTISSTHSLYICNSSSGITATMSTTDVNWNGSPLVIIKNIGTGTVTLTNIWTSDPTTIAAGASEMLAMVDISGTTYWIKIN